MPYTYKKQGDKYVVYKKSTGKKVGTTAGNKTASSSKQPTTNFFFAIVSLY